MFQSSGSSLMVVKFSVFMSTFIFSFKFETCIDFYTYLILIYIIDDKVHDRSYVAHCFAIFSEDLKNRGINVLEHWIWSDGCAS